MKGIMSVIEVMITGIILIMAFLHFFPQYSVKTEWDRVLLATQVMDTLNTIDGLGKTYELATCSTAFDDFTGNLFTPETSGAMIWWKETKDLDYTEDMHVPYFTQGYKESMVDVEFMSDEYTSDGNTVALWHFNKKGDECTIIDETGNNNGDLYPTCPGTNHPVWTVGKLNSALEFDGVNDYAGGTLSSPIPPTFTLEMWFKWTKNAGITWAHLVGLGSDHEFTLYIEQSTNDLYLKVEPSGQLVILEKLIDAISQDTWYHVAVGYDGSKYFAYLNGELKWEESNNAPSFFNDNFIFSLWGGNDFKGIIDEVRISNIRRTSFEIEYDPYSFTLGLGYPY